MLKMSNLSYQVLFFIILLCSKTSSASDCFQNFPSTLYFSQRVTKNGWYVAIQDYIGNKFPYESEDIVSPIKQQQQKFTQFNISEGIKGAAYPLFFNYSLTNDKTLKISAFNMSSQNLISTYQLHLNFSSSKCDLVFTQKNYQNSDMIMNNIRFFTICSNQTHQLARYDHFYRGSKQPYSYFYYIRSKRNNYERRDFQRQTKTYNETNVAIVYFMAQNQPSIVELYTDSSSRQPIITDETSVKKKNYMNSFILNDYLLASGNKFYIQKNYGLVFQGSLEDNWNSLQANNTFYRVLAFCQTSFIAVRSQKYIYFLQLASSIVAYDMYSKILGLYQSAKFRKDYNKNNKLFTIGKYLVQSNSTHWHIFQYKKQTNQVIQMTVIISAPQVIVDQILCKSNAFYVNNTKFIIGDTELRVPKQNKTILIKNGDCSKSVDIKIVKQNQMLFTNQRTLNSTNNLLQLREILYYGDRFQGILQTNKKDIPYKLYKRFQLSIQSDSQIINFITIDFQSVALLQKKISNSSYTVKYCKKDICQIVYSDSIDYRLVETYMGAVVHPITLRSYFYVYIRKQKNSILKSFYQNQDNQIIDIYEWGEIWSEKPFAFMGIDQWMSQQLKAKVNCRFLFALSSFPVFEQNQKCIAHGVMAKNGYKLYNSQEILTNGFTYCPSTKYNGEYILLMFRQDQDTIRFMSVANVNKGYIEHRANSDFQFKILSQKAFQNLKSAKIKCLPHGIAILNSNHVILLNGNLQIVNELDLNGNVLADLFTQNHLLHKSSFDVDAIQVIDLKNGFNVFNLKDIKLNQVVENYLSNGLLLKNGTYFNFYPQMQSITQSIQELDFLYFRVKNQTKENFRIYEVDNWNTLQLLDNRISLALKNTHLNDSIWNSTVDSIYQNTEKLSHFISFQPPRFANISEQLLKQIFQKNKEYLNLKQSLQKSLQFQRQFLIYYQQFIVQNQQQFVVIWKSFYQTGRDSFVSYKYNNQSASQHFYHAELLGSYIDNKTNNFYVKIRRNTQVCILKTIFGTSFKLQQDIKTVQNSYCFTKALPFFINEFQYRLQWQNQTFFTLQAGVASWNTSFYDFYSNNYNQTPIDVSLQYDNYQVSNRKISIYSLGQLKTQDIDGSAYDFNQKLLDFAKVKYNNSIYLLILFEKHLVLQKYQSKQFVKLNIFFQHIGIGDFVKIQTCFLSESVYEFLLISSGRNHSTLRLNWSQYPKQTVFQFNQILINDKKQGITSGMCINRMALILSSDQIFYLYSLIDSTKDKVFSCQKLDLYPQFCPQWWQRKACQVKLQRVNGDEVFVQSTQLEEHNMIFYRIKQHLQLNPQQKLIKVNNEKNNKQYKIIYVSAEGQDIKSDRSIVSHLQKREIQIQIKEQ